MSDAQDVTRLDVALLRYIIEHRFVTPDRSWSEVLSAIAIALSISPRYIRMALSQKGEDTKRSVALSDVRLEIDTLVTHWSDTQRYGQCCSAVAHSAMVYLLNKGDDPNE